MKVMANELYGPAGLVIGNGKALWVTGGNTADNLPTKSTEIVSIKDPKRVQVRSAIPGSFEFQTGPDLPMAIYFHCLIQLNSSTALLIGGSNDPDDGSSSAVQSTFFLPIPGGSNDARSMEGPDLISPRRSHACGVLKNPSDGNNVVVVAGGVVEDPKSTEMLVMDSERIWKAGPELPTGTSGAAGVTTSDGKAFLLIGGGDEETYFSWIFKLDYSKNIKDWQWTKLDQELQMGRKGHAATLVPESFCKPT